MNLFSKKTIKPLLGELEMDVMKILWEKDEANGREVWETLKGKRDIALTTVLTVIERLTQKGFLEKTKSEGPYIYKPLVSKDEFTKVASKKILRDFIDLSSGTTMASFLDVLTELDPEGIERLSAIIETKKREMNK